MYERFKSKESKKQNIKEEKRLISSRNVFDRLPLDSRATETNSFSLTFLDGIQVCLCSYNIW